MEIWVDVRNHDNYEVSSDGRVRNKKTGRILTPVLNKKEGYGRVRLDGDRQYVHRLVADSFFDGEHSRMDVNHIDGDKNNNSVSNLEWCTRRENIQHAFDNGLKFPSRVRIVRCKFCKHRNTSEFCEDRPDDFFCADGERW